ncbi:MAG: PhoH family protein, partial [Propionibacteriales bacterium]|nr:PhoH family protein [Propionibacteriales bacterium]
MHAEPARRRIVAAARRPAGPSTPRHAPARAGRRIAPVPSPEPVRTYVVDTSVLLADPAALHRFDEHEVVLPIVVITELEAKRAHPEL